MNEKILVVDDDPDLVELIQYNLEGEGYSVVVARDGQDGVKAFFNHRPQLVVLDIAMPKLDGFQVCSRIREMSDAPIVMLTAKGQENDIIKGLDLGADDYLTKPFRIGVLLARVRAALRRSRQEASTADPLIYQDDHLSIDLGAHRVMVDGELVKLSPTEFKLLAYLVKNKRRVLEFRQILESVWGFEYIDDIQYIRVYIRHLRLKIEPDSNNPVYLQNVLNTGYRFEPQN